jgi:hypothetical protein
MRLIMFLMFVSIFMLIMVSISYSEPSAPSGIVFQENIWGNITKDDATGIDGITIVLQKIGDTDNESIAITETNDGGKYTFGMQLRGDYKVIPNKEDLGNPYSIFKPESALVSIK